MANIRINGANYNDVPRLDVPSQSGDVSSFYEVSGTLSVTENGLFDVKDKEKVDVNVAGSAGGLSLDDFISGNYFDGKNITFRGTGIDREYALACTNINSFTAPQCRYLANYAFYKSSLTSFTAPEVFNIGDNVFELCANLSNVDLPKCEKLGMSSFTQSGIVRADFPEVTTLNDYAFYSCNSLISANFPKVTSIPSSCFNACENLETINIPLCYFIGDNALAYIYKLKEVSFPVCNVGVSAFSNDNGLEKVDFNPTTTYDYMPIGYSAFNNCSKLKILALRSENVWSLSDSSCFQGTLIESGTGFIYVPKSQIEQYKTATNWTVYADQFRALEDYTVDGTITGELDSTKI